MSGAGAVGGDLGTLAELKRTFERAQESARELAGTITSSLESTVWTGANARKFEELWEEFRPTLETKLPDELHKAETDVMEQGRGIAAATGETFDY